MSDDLSQVHKPITELFSQSRISEHISSFHLSQDQVEHFHQWGFVSGVRILNDEQIEKLIRELEEIIFPDHEGRELFYEYNSNESSDPNRVLFHALGAWRVRPAFHDLLWNPAMTIPASQLLGGSVRFWHDQIFVKPPKRGGVVAWHQDYSYWTRTKPMAHLTCWFALDDSTMENGCMQYIPGSHRWNLLPITGLAGDMQAIKAVLDEDQHRAFEKPMAIELKRGEATFHHPLMIHGSRENLSDRPRRGIAINLIRDGVCSDSDEPLLAGVPAFPKGAKLEGQFFPLLRDLAK